MTSSNGSLPCAAVLLTFAYVPSANVPRDDGILFAYDSALGTDFTGARPPIATI